jgi:putative Holliday junction resolvase
MNYLGIDYGRKRVGVSICHDDVRIVLPMDAIISSDDGEKIEKICELVERNKIGEIVIGYPLNMNGTIGNMAKEVDSFIGRLVARLPSYTKITRTDERLTSEQATKDSRAFYCRQSAAKKQKHRRRGVIDSMAAAVILQDFLDKL